MICKTEGCGQYIEGHTFFCGTCNAKTRKKERDERKEVDKRSKAVRISKERTARLKARAKERVSRSGTPGTSKEDSPKPSRINPYSKQGRVKKEDEWAMFRQIWEERSPFSEVSGTFLGHEYNPSFFAHIVAKGAYEGLRLEKENICLMTPGEHTVYDHETHKAKEDPKYDWVFEKREELIESYNSMIKRSLRRQV